MLIGAALFVAVAVRGDRRIDVDAAVDALTVVVVSVLVLWDVQGHVAGETAGTMLETVVLTSYPVLDAVILGLVVRLMWSPRRGSAGSLLMAAGVVLWAAADLSYLLAFLSIDSSLLNLAGWAGRS